MAEPPSELPFHEQLRVATISRQVDKRLSFGLSRGSCPVWVTREGQQESTVLGADRSPFVGRTEKGAAAAALPDHTLNGRRRAGDWAAYSFASNGLETLTIQRGFPVEATTSTPV